jgi:hypothetical protein
VAHADHCHLDLLYHLGTFSSIAQASSTLSPQVAQHSDLKCSIGRCTSTMDTLSQITLYSHPSTHFCSIQDAAYLELLLLTASGQNQSFLCNQLLLLSTLLGPARLEADQFLRKLHLWIGY